ncbi:DUF1769-domain-containing protein [Aspergillus japonicus CBS 114.51]|uniref:DUF1769-domain-containing protein n=2 Tax=Aspergillus TaxID=5052 RepID=A0A2V5H9M1_ASPV1|nr:DUF1769-domain-containing protein [Aspergillus japonicus CBS 114.51]PYI18932.1 DUF1769-domain-containing protein [Aspergillus violaceofuscus CBS 115571]RAH77890.1 DUF1769-domain-containing protein [Aspergillus japonicus CBS 114.51]
MFTSNKAPTHNHRLRITAGPRYDPQTHQLVHVNGPSPIRIRSPHLTADIWVRIKEYTGYPDSSPKSHPYFTHPATSANRYSITLSLTFHQDLNGDDLLFGNDFDHPIRDYLPPGFGAAFKVVKTMLDPSIDGDAYADKPYLYSPALASWNQFRIGEAISPARGETKTAPGADPLVLEGAEGSGAEVRERYGLPGEAAARTKHFRDEERRRGFVFEAGRVYEADFGNPYLDFEEFAIHVPGITLNISKYVSEKNNVLRYVLKNRATGQEYLVIGFTVVLDGADETPEGADEVD